MYQKIEGNLRMTDNDAAEKYADSYIIMQMDSMTSDMGTVLYVGDNQREIISLLMSFDAPYCGVVDGMNHRRSLGGLFEGE